MRKHIGWMAAVVGLCGWTWLSAAPADTPAASKARYDQVVAQLDPGGDLLVVANLEGCVQSLVSNVVLLAGLASESGQPVGGSSPWTRIPGFLDRQGFYAVQGVGASLVPREDGLNAFKVFMARDPAAADRPLWRGCVGGAPVVLRSPRFLPADTVLVRAGAGECGQFWKMFRAGMRDVLSPKEAADFDRTISGLVSNTGVDLDAAFESLLGDGFFSVQLSSTATVDLPLGAGGAPHAFPVPTVLMGVAVRDETLLAMLDGALARGQVPVLKSRVGEAEVHSVNLPMPMPFPFQPAYVIHQGFFLIGSTPEVVTAGIRAFDGGGGWMDSAEYRQAFAGLPDRNNGWVYLNPRFMRTVREVQRQMMASAGPDAMGGAVFDRIFGGDEDQRCAGVIENLEGGILMRGTTSMRGQALIGQTMMAPVGLMAAIAIPSFMKSRQASRTNACVNNLRQIDAAKEQWAMEMNQSDGADVDQGEMLKYIKGRRLPVCPQGGTYTVNRIGEMPTCSVPGHSL